jgi:hypothetical protein
MNNPMQMMMYQMMNNPKIVNNPLMQNVLQMAQKGDSKGIENIARNLCKEKGLNPDNEIQKIKQQFGMK